MLKGYEHIQHRLSTLLSVTLSCTKITMPMTNARNSPRSSTQLSLRNNHKAEVTKFRIWMLCNLLQEDSISLETLWKQGPFLALGKMEYHLEIMLFNLPSPSMVIGDALACQFQASDRSW
jgi:hypothetical protein